MAKQKHKATARQNAQNRAQSQQGLSEAPKAASNHKASHQRFPGETPLTGEDRPARSAGRKKHG